MLPLEQFELALQPAMLLFQLALMAFAGKRLLGPFLEFEAPALEHMFQDP